MSPIETLKSVLEAEWDEPRRRAEQAESRRLAEEEAREMEGLRLLLEAEAEADRIAAGAAAWRDGLPARVEAGKAALRARVREETDAAIAADAEAERARADAEIAGMAAEAEARKAELRARFAAGHDRVADRIFALVTGDGDA